MGVIIPESDMEFGVYQKEQVFRIEKSEQYMIHWILAIQMFFRIYTYKWKMETSLRNGT